ALVLDGRHGRRGRRLRRQRHLPALRRGTRQPRDRDRQVKPRPPAILCDRRQPAAAHAAGLQRTAAAAAPRRALLHAAGAGPERRGGDRARRRLRCGRDRPGGHGSRSGGAAVKKILTAQLKSTVALIVLVLVGVVVGGILMAHQRLNPPAWVPFIGKSEF